MSIVRRLGEWVAGDEKLLKFTGNSGNIRLVITKPDRVGLWFYELATRLENGLPYMLYIRMHRSNPVLGHTIKTAEIIRDWSNIVMRTDDPDSRNPDTMLVFDSYYLTKAYRDELVEKQVKFIAAVQSTRFPELHGQVDKKVEKPGEWEGIYHSRTNQLFVLHDDKELSTRKMVLSHAFTRFRETQKFKNIIPAYTAYGKMFSVCDRFNFNLGDRKWPHRHGHRETGGDRGHQNNFAWSCLLQNVFNAYMSINDENDLDYNFQDFMIELSTSLYFEAMYL